MNNSTNPMIVTMGQSIYGTLQTQNCPRIKRTNYNLAYYSLKGEANLMPPNQYCRICWVEAGWDFSFTSQTKILGVWFPATYLVKNEGKYWNGSQYINHSYFWDGMSSGSKRYKVFEWGEIVNFTTTLDYWVSTTLSNKINNSLSIEGKVIVDHCGSFSQNY